MLRSHAPQRVSLAESIARGKTTFETKMDGRTIAEIEALGSELLGLGRLTGAEATMRGTLVSIVLNPGVHKRAEEWVTELAKPPVEEDELVALSRSRSPYLTGESYL